MSSEEKRSSVALLGPSAGFQPFALQHASLFIFMMVLGICEQIRS